MKIRVNRKFTEVEISNIKQIDENGSNVLVKLFQGYPRTLKAECSKSKLLLRMVNQGLNSERIKEIKYA